MKKLIQQPGVRKWFGDEWITIQSELYEILEGLFSMKMMPFVVHGCYMISDTEVSPGIVCLRHEGAIKICRFDGATDVTFPLYLKATRIEDTGLYLDGNVKPVSESFIAEVSVDNPDGEYLLIPGQFQPALFTDAISDTYHRFCTDIEKMEYSSQANTAITTLRDGIVSSLNTLEKLRVNLQSQIDSLPQTVGVDEIYATIRGGIAGNYDTLQKLLTYIQSLEYFPEYRGNAELAGSVIDWEGKPELYKTLTANTEFDATNLIVGKTIGLKLDGAFESTFNSKFKKAMGSPNPLTTGANYIQMKCLDNTPGSEYILYSVTFIP